MKTIRNTILTAAAASFLAVSFQPANAGGGGFGPGVIKPGIGNPGIIKPWKVPGKVKPKKPHNNNNAAAAAALGLVGGMIIAGAIANSQNHATPSGDSAHVAWCDGRYKTYDWQTDTYMSNSGYRKYCNSPYN